MDGSGEAAIVKPVGVHTVQQVAVQHVAVQQVADVQQVPLVGVGQHGTKFDRAAVFCGPLVGSGQHVGAPCSGHNVGGSAPAAPAGPTNAATHNNAARERSDDGMIKRRIAENTGTVNTRICEA